MKRTSRLAQECLKHAQHIDLNRVEVGVKYRARARITCNAGPDSSLQRY
jgi:hypothetical protein